MSADLPPVLAAGAAGVASSLSPCFAPRAIAVAGIVAGVESLLWARAASFAAGLVGAYALMGGASALFSALVALTRWTDALLALGLIAAGTFMLLADGGCAGRRAVSIARPLPLFTAGAASALTAAPCCVPLVALVTGFGPRATLPALAIGAAFGAGQALAIAAASGLARRTAVSLGATAAARTVGAGLTLAAGVLHGLLA